MALPPFRRSGAGTLWRAPAIPPVSCSSALAPALQPVAFQHAVGRAFGHAHRFGHLAAVALVAVEEFGEIVAFDLVELESFNPGILVVSPSTDVDRFVFIGVSTGKAAVDVTINGGDVDTIGATVAAQSAGGR